MDTSIEPTGSAEEFRDRVRIHYDSLVDLFERDWGEHIHHGYWDAGAADGDRPAAQDRLVDRLVAFGGIPAGARILDAGCGIGGTAIRLARRLGCDVDGITLSGEQVRRATDKAAQAGVAASARFHQMDAARTAYPDGAFDVVLSVESCEVMPDKRTFLSECARLLRPGGVLVVATWCAGRDQPIPAESARLRQICRDFVLSYVLPLRRYAKLAGEVGLGDVATADWTPNVLPTWDLPAATSTGATDQVRLTQLLRTERAALLRYVRSAGLLGDAYRSGLLTYGVFRATRPA